MAIVVVVLANSAAAAALDFDNSALLFVFVVPQMDLWVPSHQYCHSLVVAMNSLVCVSGVPQTDPLELSHHPLASSRMAPPRHVVVEPHYSSVETFRKTLVAVLQMENRKREAVDDRYLEGTNRSLRADPRREVVDDHYLGETNRSHRADVRK